MLNHMNKIFPQIKILNEYFEKEANHSLAEYHITLSQMKVLIVLSNSGGRACPLKELEAVFKVSQQTIAGTVSRLEKKGLVRSDSDSQDRRIKMVSITEQGKEIAVNAEKEMDATEKRVSANLTAEEQEIFLNLLQKLCSNYEAIKR